MTENSNIEVKKTRAYASKRQFYEDLCITVTTLIGFLASVETNSYSKYHFVRITKFRYHPYL